MIWQIFYGDFLAVLLMLVSYRPTLFVLVCHKLYFSFLFAVNLKKLNLSLCQIILLYKSCFGCACV